MRSNATQGVTVMAETSIGAGASIGRVRLRVADLTAMTRFYCDVLGLRRAPGDDDRIARLSVDGRPPFLFELEAVAGASRPPRGSTGLYHSAVLLPSRAWLGRLLRHLARCGVALDGASDHLVSEALYLRDPEGNGVELYADRPRETWPRRGGAIVMTTEPLDLDALAAAGAEGPWSGAPAGTRIGHIHLRVAALDRAEAFYHGVAGFDVTLRAYPGALFFSAGGYHHHVGVNVWGSAGGSPPPGAATGLQSFAILLPDGRELAEVVRRAGAAGVAIETGSPRGGAVLLRDWDGIGVEVVAETAPAGQPEPPAAGPVPRRA